MALVPAMRDVSMRWQRWKEGAEQDGSQSHYTVVLLAEVRHTFCRQNCLSFPADTAQNESLCTGSMWFLYSWKPYKDLQILCTERQIHTKTGGLLYLCTPCWYPCDSRKTMSSLCSHQYCPVWMGPGTLPSSGGMLILQKCNMSIG